MPAVGGNGPAPGQCDSGGRTRSSSASSRPFCILSNTRRWALVVPKVISIPRPGRIRFKFMRAINPNDKRQATSDKRLKRARRRGRRRRRVTGEADERERSKGLRTVLRHR